MKSQTDLQFPFPAKKLGSSIHLFINGLISSRRIRIGFWNTHQRTVSVHGSTFLYNDDRIFSYGG